MSRILNTYGGGFMPAAINLHPPLKGTSIVALFVTAAINLQRHCNIDGAARHNSTYRYRSNGPLAVLFWALAAVLARRNSPFFLQCKLYIKALKHTQKTYRLNFLSPIYQDIQHAQQNKVLNKDIVKGMLGSKILGLNVLELHYVTFANHDQNI